MTLPASMKGLVRELAYPGSYKFSFKKGKKTPKREDIMSDIEHSSKLDYRPLEMV